LVGGSSSLMHLAGLGPSADTSSNLGRLGRLGPFPDTSAKRRKQVVRLLTPQQSERYLVKFL